VDSQIFKLLAANKDAIVALAAIGALVISAITAVLGVFGVLKSKMIDVDIKRQDAVRKLVEADMVSMGEAMHQTLAFATILVKKFCHTVHPHTTNLEESIAKYKIKIDESKKVLLDAKTTYHYKFHGLEDGLTSIARVADWVKGLKTNPDLANRLLEQADAISTLIDKAIVRAYRDGKHPTLGIKFRIKYRVWRIHRMWSQYKESKKDGAYRKSEASPQRLKISK
jgi:hypothetical protein